MSPHRRADGRWRVAVILEHILPSGDRHFDWLFDEGDPPLDPAARRLRAFRCDCPAAGLEVGDTRAIESMGRHRGKYLSIDTPTVLAEDRGTVSTVFRGLWRNVESHRPESVQRIELRVDGTADHLAFEITSNSTIRRVPG